MSVVEKALSAFTAKINKNPHGIDGFHAVYHFYLDGNDGGDYQVEFANNQASFQKGITREAKCSLELSGTDLIQWLEGKLNPAVSIITGKMKIKGDIGLSIKLQTVLHTYQI
ncbi:SCP2 sterol-binding domain-containing protein [Brevibacillus sp. NRS-1366]|uniref:SCP2 sterol-binding domain-containing protein n=1 Tax=Brevibacillus sp. NRS-1366 TaxID=3233899 RepID=UPI003D1E8881